MAGELGRRQGAAGQTPALAGDKRGAPGGQGPGPERCAQSGTTGSHLVLRN